MGFERKAIRAMLSAVLLSSAAAAGAATVKEPLIVTRLADPDHGIESRVESTLQIVRTRADVDKPDSLDQAMDSFGRAIGQAITLEQQAIQSACNSAERPKPGTAAAYDWRARCSYQRY